MSHNCKIWSCCLVLFIVSTGPLAAQATSYPYDQLAPLIGRWQIERNSGSAYMDIAWGLEKTYVTITNENDLSGSLKQENYSLLVWDGMARKFAVTTSYTQPESLLYGHGFMYMVDNVYYRELQVHYEEGQFMPFEKKPAGKGGKSMPYRQTWTIVDENTFHGVFEINIDGKYQLPPYKKDKKPEVWTRVR